MYVIEVKYRKGDGQWERWRDRKSGLPGKRAKGWIPRFETEREAEIEMAYAKAAGWGDVTDWRIGWWDNYNERTRARRRRQ